MENHSSSSNNPHPQVGSKRPLSKNDFTATRSGSGGGGGGRSRDFLGFTASEWCSQCLRYRCARALFGATSTK